LPKGASTETIEKIGKLLKKRGIRQNPERRGEIRERKSGKWRRARRHRLCRGNAKEVTIKHSLERSGAGEGFFYRKRQIVRAGPKNSPD